MMWASSSLIGFAGATVPIQVKNSKLFSLPTLISPISGMIQKVVKKEPFSMQKAILKSVKSKKKRLFEHTGICSLNDAQPKNLKRFSSGDSIICVNVAARMLPLLLRSNHQQNAS